MGRSYFATSGEAGVTTPRPGQWRGGLIGSIRRYFWGTPTPPGEKRTNYHVPLAADLAAGSAALLFSQPPALTCEDDSAAQEWLEGAVDAGMHAKFLESAETCAALSGVFLRTVWDTDIADSAWLDLVPPDAAVPEWRYDRLAAVTFWTVLHDEGKTVVRHMEKHIPHENVILHGVFVGSQQKVGRRVDLKAFPQTRPLAAVCNAGGARSEAISLPDLPGDASTVAYVPNMRPNRLWRDLGPQAAPFGRSDFSPLETLLDGLDEAWSSWMRDIRLGKARLIVPHTYLDSLGNGKGAVFEPDREIYSPLNMLVTGESTNGTGILPQQFDVRWEAHQQTVQSMIETIITRAGYSGQTLGQSGDIAQTATEVVARERKSLTTRGRKINYWGPALADTIYGLMAVNQAVYGSGITPVRPNVEFPDSVLPDALELAQTVAALRSAEAMSIETAVATAHPDWDKTQVAAEVGRIYQEMSLDAMSRARVTIGGSPTETLEQQLASIPVALAPTDRPEQVEQVASNTDELDGGSQIE